MTAGLGWLLDWIDATHITDLDLDLLRSQRNVTGKARFDEGFRTWLKESGDFTSVSIRAVPEGRVVHAHAPPVVVEGPLAVAQILETSLLNHLNYQTLVATQGVAGHRIGEGQSRARVRATPRTGCRRQRRGPGCSDRRCGHHQQRRGCPLSGKPARRNARPFDGSAVHGPR